MFKLLRENKVGFDLAVRDPAGPGAMWVVPSVQVYLLSENSLLLMNADPARRDRGPRSSLTDFIVDPLAYLKKHGARELERAVATGTASEFKFTVTSDRGFRSENAFFLHLGR